jgi:hypothetical protein
MSDWFANAVAGAVAGGFTGFLSSYVMERIRRRWQKQQSVAETQLANIREHVLNRIRALLEKHYLPILQNERASVGVFTENLPRKEAHVGEWADETQESLQVIRPGDEMNAPGVPNYFHGGESKWAEEPQSLWRDAQRTYRSLFQSWDQFIKDFDAYQRVCLSEVNRLYAQIAAAHQIPEYSPTIREPPWVNARGLAWYAFFRSLGLQSARMPLGLSQDGQWYAVRIQNSALVIATKEQTETYWKLVEAFSQASTDAIDQRRRLLLEKASALYEEVQRLTL